MVAHRAGGRKFDEKELAHYREVVAALRERGMEPVVTLWHWTLPVWLAEKGGVLSGDFSRCFARYAETAVRALPQAAFFITVNEPEIFALNGYLKKRWPPQKQNPFLFLWALCRLIAAHRKAYAAIKKARPDATIGASINLAYYEAASGPVNHLMAGAARRWNLFFLRNTRHSLDFIGLNYYFHNRVDHGFNRNKDRKRNDMGWEIYPEGIYHVLRDSSKYKLPIYVTENGIAGDPRRCCVKRS